MLHYKLLVATKGLTTNGVREIIYHLSKLVQWVCAKVVVTQELPIMYIVLTLLEMHLPTSFFSSSFVDSLSARSRVSWPLVKHRV